MKKLIVMSLFNIGDFLYGMGATDYEFGYSVYNWFMSKSSDLDEKWKIGFWRNLN